MPQRSERQLAALTRCVGINNNKGTNLLVLNLDGGVTAHHLKENAHWLKQQHIWHYIASSGIDASGDII